eukprot:TRINITY_DN25351_c0_g1_i1.p1 TRINITY_DN25351_c0_g1~~TRINITY_DN25351_c0_g1_i1.p1  ORF type:complete len:312 (-),score=63.91 TRINITY_DN25351_c0_g1_i1:18-908(-)
MAAAVRDVAWRRILVTGGNRGIGLAIVRRLLTETTDAYVYLGCRDEGRGSAALASLVADKAAWAARLEVLVINPVSEVSVATAAARICEPMYGIVNNAGAFLPFAEMLDLHLFGPKRVNDAFASKLVKGGRIVNISSGGAPSCVARCSDELQTFLARTDLVWTEIEDCARRVEAQIAALGQADDDAVLASTGVSWGLGGYGFTKALLNCYTACLQRQQPHLVVASCNPGFIETDLSRPFAEQSGKSPAEMGMRHVDQGAIVPCKLLLEDVEGQGAYYESDGTVRGFAEAAPDDFES